MEKVPDKLTRHTSLLGHPPCYCENTLVLPRLAVPAFTPLPVGESPANIKASLQLVPRTPTVSNRSSQNGKCSHACVTRGSGGQDTKGVMGPRSRAGAVAETEAGPRPLEIHHRAKTRPSRAARRVHRIKESRSATRFLTPAKRTLQLYFPQDLS